MTKLGGHALYLKPGEIHLGQKESIKDTAKVLSRMVDVIEIRALKHETVTGFAEHALVPVINGLTDYNHPTQALCDAFTMQEHKLADKTWSDLRVVFVGDATNVCVSLALIVTMLGGTFVHARPEQYGIKAQWPTVLDELADNASRFGGTYIGTEEVEDAVSAADFIYTDLWWWFGQEDEIRTGFVPSSLVTRSTPTCWHGRPSTCASCTACRRRVGWRSPTRSWTGPSRSSTHRARTGCTPRRLCSPGTSTRGWCNPCLPRRRCTKSESSPSWTTPRRPGC